MKFENLTPELAAKLGDSFLQAKIQMGVDLLTPDEKALSNALHAVQYLTQAKADLARSRGTRIEASCRQRVDQLQMMLASGYSQLLSFLSTIPD